MNRKNKNRRRQEIFDLLTKSHPEWKIKGMTYTEIKELEKRRKNEAEKNSI